MRNKLSIFMAMAAVMVLSIFGAPSVSQATLVTTVTVTVGGTSYTLWDAGLVGIDLLPGQSVTLAQTSGFNFDTSDVHTAINPVINVNSGTLFTDTTGTLNFKGTDPGTSASFNEAQQYTSIGTNGGFEVFVAYFDNVHSDLCGSGVTALNSGGVPAGTCIPTNGNGFFNSATNTLIGSGTANPGITETNPNHCANVGGASNCWDSAVVQIVALSGVPEPTSLLLLGSGLIGVAAWRRRHLKKSA